ncbi:MAG: hypothetical protein F4Z10_07660 [Synechococcus sp. SB0666_bin_14]|nr:hypothetical protein [Synechococcus sp. SB0666_bin_14]MYG47640.1 hypothetical protein [Synechococcus sp. SB0675_bin_6]MYJ59220.1 hypothetical protein [Synechococcus sp. SB0672_bin_6]MYK91638.1 hypothetical protein [Synechococcus sp. SB0669_bin_8]
MGAPMNSRTSFCGASGMSLPFTALLTAFIRLKDASGPGRKLRILSSLLNGPYLPRPDPTKLPRIIWCYWAQGYENAPEIVKYCLSSWKRHNPTWDVRFLTAETVSDYIDTAEMDVVFQKSTHFEFPKALYSDFLRLKLLQTYGGIWADATLLCTCPLDTWLHTLMPSGVLMFQRPVDDSCPVASFFITAQKNNPLITRWSKTFESYLSKRQLVSTYYAFESTIRQYRSVQAYFLCHYILDFLIKFDRPTRSIFRAMPSLDAKRLEILQNWTTSGGELSAATLPDLTGIPIHKLSWKLGIKVSDVERVLSHQPQI